MKLIICKKLEDAEVVSFRPTRRDMARGLVQVEECYSNNNSIDLSPIELRQFANELCEIATLLEKTSRTN